MSSKIPNYEREFIKALRENDLEVINLLDSKNKDLKNKIKNFSLKHGFLEKEVIKEIRKNKFLRSVFSKDPGKQKIHENIAAKFIKNISGVKKFRQLPHGELALLRGGLLPKKDIVKLGAHRSAKTIDFSWEFKNHKIFASHKYTKEGGGAQDNQYSDLQEFINEANHSSLEVYFLAIADGAYYDSRDTNYSVSKMQYLKNLANKRNVFVVNIYEIEEWLSNLREIKASEKM